MAPPSKEGVNIFLFSFLIAAWIHGDLFRDHADHILDRSEIFVPEAVKEGETIFVHPIFLFQFFRNFHPKILSPYILITHKFPSSVPDRFQSYLDDPKLLYWYGINATVNHPKLRQIPLGVPTPRINAAKRDTFFSSNRPILLYLNFSDETHQGRKELRKYFETTEYCLISEAKKYEEYLADLAQSKFVLSPRGIGIDCYRTWEALVQGAIPIVLTSPLDSLFLDLPILIVQNWSEITESLLIEQYDAMRSKEYNWEKLQGDYWLDKIRGPE